MVRCCGLSPRLRGNPRREASVAVPSAGLSPRLRGNRLLATSSAGDTRSIPAPAGEPPSTLDWRVRITVYPPRLRGNLLEFVVAYPCSRSIPAPAGEPSGSGGVPVIRAVYPRACGGTVDNSRLAGLWTSLSPRLRGNRDGLAGGAAERRSIPAPAGEPGPHHRARHHHPVYPRACGGTATPKPGCCCSTGLSPRLRGNLRAKATATATQGSIPAPAGEPPGGGAVVGDGEVYPRACGGTVLPPGPEISAAGLSPRLRGNPSPPHPGIPWLRSIPAPAGEPGRPG